MEEEKVQNIPHMHLFLVLKRQFPELRDADVTDCIQRFGLNKQLCEKELTQRINDQQKVYYSPWSPRRPSSRTLEASISSGSVMPLINGDDLSSLNVGNPKIEDDLLQDVGHKKNEYTDSRRSHSTPLYANSNPFIYQPLVRRKSTEATIESRKPTILHQLSEHPETEDDENVNTFSPDRSAPSFQGSRTDTPNSPPSSIPASNTISSSSPYSDTSSRDVDVGMKHVSSLHFVPCSPYSVHHAPLPPSRQNGPICVSNRSYTSVNLQLRPPAGESQGPVIRNGANPSLTYSTSTLDQCQGSRSSLQISIGPMGGSVSAVRTNLHSVAANTAFHIQYSNNPVQTVIPRKKQIIDGSQCNVSRRKDRPQSWVMGMAADCDDLPFTSMRRTSLPETSDRLIDDIGNVDVPCSKCHPHLYGAEFSSWASNPVIIEAVISDQLERISKLEGELKYRREEKNKLDEEIQILQLNHDGKETEQKRDIENYKKKIENLMKENIFLLSDCDVMTQKILEEYEDPSLAALEKQDNSAIPQSNEVNSRFSAFKNKSGDHSHFGSVNDRHAAPRARHVVPSGTTNYSQRHQDRSPLSQEVECDWACSKCTFLNHATLSHCEMCGFGNFPGGALEPATCYCHRRFDDDYVSRSPGGQ